MAKRDKGALVTRYWLAAAVGAAVFLAWLFPGPGIALPGWHVLDVGVVVIMFLGSLKLAPGRFREAASRPHLIVLSAAAVFAAAPLFSLGLAGLFGFDTGPDRTAVLICSSQASTMATAIALTEVAGGDTALAMVITVVNNTITMILTPLIFRVLGNSEIEVDYLAMGLEIALKIVLPVMAAQIARLKLADFAARNSRKLSLVSQAIVVIYVYAGASAGMGRLSDAGWVLPRVMALAALLHLAMLAFTAVTGFFAARSADQRTAFVLCSSQKTLPAAILIWKSHFPSLPLGPLVAVAYHLTQLVADSIMAPGFKRLPLIRNKD